MYPLIKSLCCKSPHPTASDTEPPNEGNSRLSRLTIRYRSLFATTRYPQSPTAAERPLCLYQGGSLSTTDSTPKPATVPSRHRRRLRGVAIAATVVLTGVLLTACNDHFAKTDGYTCVFSGADANKNELIKQIPPGDPKFESPNENDYEVVIPASDRFYYASNNDAVRDTLAPNFYVGYTVGHLPVDVQGQVKFKFNLSKSCDWYTKSGKRNANGAGDLGFNARTPEEQKAAGWFHYLAENFGAGLTHDAKVVAQPYSWQQLNYNYPINADPTTGVLPDGAQPEIGAMDKFGIELGELFTKNLSASMGGQYFCGIQVTNPLTGEAIPANECPPMIFYPDSITPENGQLITDQESVEGAKQAAIQSQAKADLLQQQKDATLSAEQLQQEIDAVKAQTIAGSVLLDPEVQKCLAYAKVGLDCDGHWPSLYGSQPSAAVPAPEPVPGG